MAEILAHLDLDTFRENEIPILKIPMGDYGARYIKAVITAQGKAVTVPSSAVVSLRADRRADGASKIFVGTVESDGSVKVPLDKWVLALEGDVYCSVTVTGTDYKYSTNNFIVEVTYSPDGASEGDDDPGVSDTEYVILLEMITALSARVASLEARMDDLSYEKIDIISFSATYGGKTTVEMSNLNGMDASANIEWSLNRQPQKLTLGTEILSPTITGDTSRSFKIPNTPSDVTFTLKATGEKNDTDTSTARIAFYNGVYYGVVPPGDIDRYTMLNVLTKELRNSHKPSFTVTAGAAEHICYCAPVRLGKCSFKIGGFNGGFNNPQILTFENSSGYTEDYYCYMSTNPGLGNTEVEVTKGE